MNMERYEWIKIPTPFALMELIALKNGFAKEEEWFEAAKEMAIWITCPRCRNRVCELNRLTVEELSDFVAGRLLLSCAECGEKIN
jgi:hypothetical protein